MCLITEQKKAIRTTEDMIVWKVLRKEGGCMFSMYRSGFYWELGVLYKQKLLKSKDPSAYDMAVAGAYDIDIWGPCAPQLRDKALVAIGAGFHACETKERIDTSFGFKRPFLVPAGSLIYKDRTGLIVSNQIMMLPEENL